MNFASKRFPTILGMGFLLLGLGAGVYLVRQRQVNAPRAAPQAPPSEVTVTNITDRSFTVSWVTVSDSTGNVRYGKNSNQLSTVAPDDRDLQNLTPYSGSTHYVTVGGLTPGSTYYFTIHANDQEFGSNGSPYAVTTAPSLSGAPAADTAQGIVLTAANIPAASAIVYASVPGGQAMSALTTAAGNWLIPLSTTRRADLSGWLDYDRSTTTYTLRVNAGTTGRATATLSTELDRPTPPIILGKTFDFRQGKAPLPSPSAAPPGNGNASPTPAPNSQLSSQFSFSSFGDTGQAATEVTIDNPAADGEVILTDKPEFFGRGPQNTQIEITVQSDLIQGNVVVDGASRWSFAVPSKLTPGIHQLTVRWTNQNGIVEQIVRSFVVSAEGGAAFTSTPSATPMPTASPTPTPTPTPMPRTSVPSTESGIPESGNLTPSLVVLAMGGLSFLGGLVLLLMKKERMYD